ncbi:LysR family transcriptional regulator [Thioclava sp. FR2]|uniref:LysR family transcriptional regulator n=1 Tax=Thioclava sp. FR2 TaxID=3445780 RepID=UPI003EC04619
MTIVTKTDFNDLIWFLAVAEEGNFTRAAAKLGVVQSTLSHRIKRLETRMGIRLLARTTRSVSTTEAGERLIRALAPRVSEIEEEIAALMELRDKPAGSVRITLSHHALTHLVWPNLLPVLREFPDIRLELNVNAGFRDIVEEGFDAGIRLGESVEHDMIALRVGPDWRLLRWPLLLIFPFVGDLRLRKICLPTTVSTVGWRQRVHFSLGNSRKMAKSCVCVSMGG